MLYGWIILEDDLMNSLSLTISRTMEALPGTPDLAFPDLGALLPFAAVCLASIVCTALWLLAVSSHVSRSKVRVSR
jgi:hypothetical protein